ncbi:seven-hairpin glycosidase [Coprinopsis marcescibilis]|uniref:alpha-1,2-Mannosidase n=1 Tax=Coprinopsis marcescibilis TaxID=230819 RepID=A0A5C3KPV4_COPMA|nr:seven-hairpin glycosidase [Coprinopsis marcescibilis]
MALRRLLLSTALFGAAYGGLVQKPNLVVPPAFGPYAAEVKEMFVGSYEAYKTYAWGFDDLYPMSKTGGNGRNGWGATIVDSMSTMYIMGLTDLFEEAVEFSSKIDFTQSKIPDKVSVFETTIRFLGGLLSAYEMSDGKYPALIERATELTDKMAYAWIGDNNIPHGFLNFTDNTAFIARTNIAEAGTLLLEWETLSKHTGNNTYAELTLRSQRHIASLPSPFPGLAVTWIQPDTGEWIGGYITWGGAADSYYEYLIKHARLSNTDDHLFADVWATAVDSSIHNLMKTSTVGNFTYLADFDSNSTIRHIGSHLACFHGGNWIYGGKLINNETIVNYGLDLVEGCWNTYSNTPSGIGPESFGYASSEGEYSGDTEPISDKQREFYNRTGFYPRNTNYILRPEVLESNFYAWRATGDTKYLERAVSAIKAFKKNLLAPSGGYASLDDVTLVEGPKLDFTESFWYAETLKYLYLTFDDPNHINIDEWVFNTEAHPFKAPLPKDTYAAPSRYQRPAPTRAWVLQGDPEDVDPGYYSVNPDRPGPTSAQRIFDTWN